MRRRASSLVLHDLRHRLGLPERTPPKPARTLAKHAVQGAVAGLAATWVMDRVTTYLYENESRTARRREDRVRHGRTTYEEAADQIATRLGTTLNRRDRRRYGTALHWTVGATAGAVYGALGTNGRPTLVNGLRFGTAFWLFMDETVTPALGITAGPRAFPWQAHARGLAGHAAWGLGAAASLRVLRRLTRRA